MFTNIFTHLVSKLQDNNVLNSVESTTIFNCCTHYGFKHCVSVQMLHWKSHSTSACTHNWVTNGVISQPLLTFMVKLACYFEMSLFIRKDGNMGLAGHPLEHMVDSKRL